MKRGATLALLLLAALARCATRPERPDPSDRSVAAPAPVIQAIPTIAVGDGGELGDPTVAEARPSITDGGVPLYNPAPPPPQVLADEPPRPGVASEQPEDEVATPKSDPTAYRTARAEAQKLAKMRRWPEAMKQARAAELESLQLTDRDNREAAEALGRIAADAGQYAESRRAFDRALQRCEARGFELCRRRLYTTLTALSRRAKLPALAVDVEKIAFADKVLVKSLAAGRLNPADQKKLRAELAKALAAYRAYGDRVGAARARAAQGALDALLTEPEVSVKELLAADRSCAQPRCKQALRPFYAATGKRLRARNEVTYAAQAFALDNRAGATGLVAPEARRYFRTPDMNAACDLVNASEPGRCVKLMHEVTGEDFYRDFGRASPTRHPLAAEQIAAVYAEYAATLTECFTEDVRRNKTLAERSFGIEWTVGNDGRVAEVHMELRSEDGSPLYQCVAGKLAIWRYPRFSGERTNVSQRFDVKAKTRSQLFEWYEPERRG